MKPLLALAGVGLLLICVQKLHADSTASTSQPTTQSSSSFENDPQLKEIDTRAANVHSLSAHFEQEKFTSLLKKPLKSSGTVRASGDITRWDTEKPQPSVLFSNGKEIRLYYPSQKLEEIYPLDPKMRGMLASPLPRFGTLSQYFSITRTDTKVFEESAGKIPPSAVVIQLLPTDDFLKKHVQEVDVAIDAQSAMALAMQTIDSDGDRTVMFFSDAKPNAEIKPDDIDLKVPADTTVSHPAEGAPPMDVGQGK